MTINLAVSVIAMINLTVASIISASMGNYGTAGFIFSQALIILILTYLSRSQ